MNRSVVTEGDPFAVVATVENPAERQASVTARLSLFGEVVTTRSVSVGPGEERRVQFVRRIEAPGEYTVGVNGQQASVVVEEDGVAESQPLPMPKSGGSSMDAIESIAVPLLGALVPLVVLVAAGRRWLE